MKDYIGQGSGVTQRKRLAPSSGGYVHMCVCVHTHVAVLSMCGYRREGGDVAYLRLSFRFFFLLREALLKTLSYCGLWKDIYPFSLMGL